MFDRAGFGNSWIPGHNSIKIDPNTIFFITYTEIWSSFASQTDLMTCGSWSFCILRVEVHCPQWIPISNLASKSLCLSLTMKWSSVRWRVTEGEGPCPLSDQDSGNVPLGPNKDGRTKVGGDGSLCPQNPTTPPLTPLLILPLYNERFHVYCPSIRAGSS